MRSLLRRGPLAALAVTALLAPPAGAHGHHDGNRLDKIRHFVVIYQENHSFDNLYGGWEGVDGISRAPAARTTQVSQAGMPFRCLLQNDVNLTSPPLAPTCTATPPASHFFNAPFRIDDYIAPMDTTCPEPGVSAPNGVPKGSGLPGGCTRDLVHRFYQEQYQLNGGRQNRYVTGSDAVGLTMGYYDTKQLPIYRYLHERGHPDYVISDRFFQAAFGGSFLNHQWLIAAASPVFYNARNDGSADDLHSLVDGNGMPTSYPLYTATGPVKDAALTVPCSSPRRARHACGDYAVNTIQPFYQPYAPGTAEARRLPPQTHATIGDRLSAKGIDWAWYSGGWSNANGDVGGPGWTNGSTPGTCTDPDTAAGAVYPNCPSKLFQYHHQAFNYFKAYAPGTQARRRHLRDEAEFEALAGASRRHCELKPVSLIKPVGAENEHPGYASEHEGSDHLVDLLDAVERSRCAKDTMVIVTYDEFGGQWDHVPPPGQGAKTPGPHDQMGPGTRIPALTIAPGLHRSFSVDHASHDTTSIMATIERRFRLRPVTARDAAVRDLSTVFR
ncbi:MAG TPA: alkaline phosphatase family protein [Solirubrobacteraceae bacterium]|nr:alkaline phosphatase family protein [Solirubrobacteraceae bacterium]